MSDNIFVALAFYIPLTVVCGILFALGRAATHHGVSRVLRWSAVIWFVLLAVIIFLALITPELCAGSMIYGYSTCTGISSGLASLSLPLLIVGVLGGAAYSVILLVVSGFLEWRHRARARDIA